MPGMGLADLVFDLKASLLDAAGAFRAPDDADFIRHVRVAAEALASARPRTAVASVALVAGQAEYPAPADLWLYKSSIWGTQRCQPWEKRWPGRLPDVRVAAGALWLTPAPTAHQVAVLGATFTFFYYALHAVSVDAGETTVPAGERDLLLLRAQAEAMRELAMRDGVRPTSARDGFSGTPRSGLPSALYQAFMAEFDARKGAR